MTQPQRAAIIEIARALVGTRWRHQSRDASRGLDCIGVVLAAYCGAGWTPLNPDAAFHTNYAREADDEAMRAAIENECDAVEFDKLLPADLLLIHSAGFQFPQHVALVSEIKDGGVWIIHAVAGTGKGVIEQHLDAQMRRDVVSCWRFKGVSDG